jgi:superfamily II DNA or RNA helicase
MPPPGASPPLLELLAPHFSPTIRDRGTRYHVAGRVFHVRGDAKKVEAVVRGEHSYTASIRWHRGQVEFACTCPFFNDGQTCKHLWALALAAAEKNLLAGVSQGLSLGKKSADGSRDGSGVPPAEARWRRVLEAVSEVEYEAEPAGMEPAAQRIIYMLDAVSVREGSALQLGVSTQTLRRNGQWSPPKPLNLSRTLPERMADPMDRMILSALAGCEPDLSHGSSAASGVFALSDAHRELLLPLLCSTGRFFARAPDGTTTDILTLDPDDTWFFFLDLVRVSDTHYHLVGVLRRKKEAMGLDQPVMLLPSGWVFTHNRLAPLNHGGSFAWIVALRQTGPVTVPAADAETFIQQFFTSPHLPPTTLPPELAPENRATAPRCKLLIRPHPLEPHEVCARLAFTYGGQDFTDTDLRPGLLDWPQRVFYPRDFKTEQAAVARLQELGFRRHANYSEPGYPYHLPAILLPAVIQTLLPQGWLVEASGKMYRAARTFSLKVASGTDWFDLQGDIQFDGAAVSLPALLNAIRKGEKTVVLDDGSLGVVPEEWLRRMNTLAALGEEQDGSVRFKREQALLLDALLAEQTGVDVDATFARIRSELKDFQTVEALDAPEGFRGSLRPYQREGLGWFAFLRRFGFGGCLADDMGLGKTVQVLALLEQRRQEKSGPSLVVVPRSLMFNWRTEAERFTPALRILEHSGISRARSTGHLADYDLILTTYGTLRRDTVLLKDMAFDYVILDEAQAIKNAGTHSAKAARLLRGKHRLALSGTPVENHLGELWSLFEFLNPGMMGRASAFEQFTGNAGDPAVRPLLARTLRPFILRRTKGQVATELPARLEQTLHCDLPASQRKLYNELRDYYRQALLKKVNEHGMGRAKIMVLEALLRLRQAACHPGLVDPAHRDQESAKLSTLIPQLLEVTQEGHKALVFSQFTSFLSLVKQQVEAAGLTYEYLDGKTRDRQARVDRFQNDPECRLFLISLRAGGLGLNLTAAEYVFLLDPWWNPAVEAQAIDRAHRIGQKQQVFAYRLIARDTIEEKVLELQAGKRDLASAIITEDQSILRNLTREDLELLLT